MNGIAARLREERKRLGFTQDDMARAGGISKRSQAAYETEGGSLPDAQYLAAIGAAGADVLYVVTGAKHPIPADSLTASESAHLQRYRTLSPSVRAAVDTLTEALALQVSPA